MTDAKLDELCINTIRTLSIDAVQKANSGHPGLPMGAAAAAYVLWTRFLRHNPSDPSWPDRDRFVLSAGHGSMLLYSLLHLTGYDLPLEQIKQFRQWGSLTPGHPESHLTKGVEATTGPLGQGMGNAVGMAIAEAHGADQERDVVDVGADRIGAFRLVALAVAAQVEGDHAVPPREVLRLRREERAVAGPAMDEHESRPALAPALVGQLDALVRDRRHDVILPLWGQVLKYDIGVDRATPNRDEGTRPMCDFKT